MWKKLYCKCINEPKIKSFVCRKCVLKLLLFITSEHLSESLFCFHQRNSHIFLQVLCSGCVSILMRFAICPTSDRSHTEHALSDFQCNFHSIRDQFVKDTNLQMKRIGGWGVVKKSASFVCVEELLGAWWEEITNRRAKEVPTYNALEIQIQMKRQTGEKRNTNKNKTKQKGN